MKLGNSIFYNLEGKRQDYIQSYEVWPYLGGFLGLGFFIFYAYRTPLNSNLYKELMKSIFLGGATGYGYVHYYKRIYMQEVDKSYQDLKDKFNTNPILSTIKED
jgi:hypothetical protein